MQRFTLIAPKRKTRGVVREEPEQKLYYFSVQDKDAEVLTFTFIARSLVEREWCLNVSNS